MHQVQVWDLATRLFHWLLVLFVVVCFLTGEDEGFVFAVHAYAGYVVFVLLVFRVGWGIIGSQHSRFSDFVYPWSTVRRYVISFLRFKPEHYVGHNPLGGWMIILMLVVLLITAISGVLMVTKGAGWLEGIHETLGELMQIFVLIHIAGVLIDRLLTGEKIIEAMFTGRKELADGADISEGKMAGMGTTLIFAGLVLVGSLYLFQQIGYPAKVASFATHEDDAPQRKDDND